MVQLKNSSEPRHRIRFNQPNIGSPFRKFREVDITPWFKNPPTGEAWKFKSPENDIYGVCLVDILFTIGILE